MHRRRLLAGLVGLGGLRATDSLARKRRRKGKGTDETVTGADPKDQGSPEDHEDHATTERWANPSPRVVNYLPEALSAYGEHATADWKAATGNRLCLTHETRPTKTCEDGVLPEQGEIALCWSSQRVGKSGTTQLFHKADGVTITAALIKLYGPTSDPGLAWTIPHELGHAIGLPHASVPPEQSIMRDSWPTPAREPRSHDIAVATALYQSMDHCA